MDAYTFACLDDTQEHGGDCTYAPSTCITCLYETYYCEALVQIAYFEDLLQIQPKEIKEMLIKYNDIILLLTVLQMTQSYWDNWQHNYDNHIKEPDSESCLREFLTLSAEEQHERYKRMEKVMNYVNNPIPIEGIPWW